MQDKKEFVINRSLLAAELNFHPSVNGMLWHIDQDIVLSAVIKTNKDMDFQLEEHAKWEQKDIPTLLGHIPLKNLSGAIGEVLGANYCFLSDQDIRRNPHESGSPDYLPYFTATEEWIKKPTKDAYLHGGFDSKGCKVNEIKFMSVDASSHHDQTSTILVAAWKMEAWSKESWKEHPWKEKKERPQIVGVFYTNALAKTDWKIGSLPKNNGSKPTSSAQLLLSGLEKLRSGWVVLHKSVSPPTRDKDILKYRLDVLLEAQIKSTSACP